MIRTEPAQVKFTEWLKPALCYLCYYYNLLNQFKQV